MGTDGLKWPRCTGAPEAGTFCAAANAALYWALGQILFRQIDRQSDQRHDDGCARDPLLRSSFTPPSRNPILPNEAKKNS